ncbi:hypothetical protein [Methanosarcina horonobensis]|nr:hypothetical protein [Methanosarcina horonobensis]
MRKNILVYVSVALLILALWGLWQYGNGADVYIADMNASPLGLGNPDS